MTTLERLLHAAPTFKKSLKLEHAHALDAALSFPTSAYPTIHIAGSNGKGSVATKIAHALICSGYRVGLYTSPHLFSFCERIAVNGIPITEEELTLGVQRLCAIEERLHIEASFFELATFLAFDYFRKCNVDVAVVETGLGGRYDATNILLPLLCIITSISREHTHILGDKLEQIALEKAGILKEKVPLVLGPSARLQTVYDRAKELCCPVTISKKISPFFDEENSAIAALALEQLKAHFDISKEALVAGLAVRPPCRFERIEGAVFDVAHNPAAIFSLLQALHSFYPEGKFRFLVGFSKDKEYDRCLQLIAGAATHIHLVHAAMPRAAAPEELERVLKKENYPLCTAHPSVEEGAAKAAELARAQEEILVICGSFYIMAAAHKVLLKG